MRRIFMGVVSCRVQQECNVNAWQAAIVLVAEHAVVCVCRDDLRIHQILYNS